MENTVWNNFQKYNQIFSVQLSCKDNPKFVFWTSWPWDSYNGPNTLRGVHYKDSSKAEFLPQVNSSATKLEPIRQRKWSYYNNILKDMSYITLNILLQKKSGSAKANALLSRWAFLSSVQSYWKSTGKSCFLSTIEWVIFWVTSPEQWDINDAFNATRYF